MIAISASFTGGIFAAPQSVLARAKHVNDMRPVVWRGIALGAQAQITLDHENASSARDILERCREEISRLEGLFSLYQPKSALRKLNRNGHLANPEPEMLELISRSVEIGSETGGAFDITVQPLWRLYADHFSTLAAAKDGPSDTRIKEALRLVDYKQVDVSPQSITLKQSGMEITLNGIAQGYVTDKVAALLRRAGYTNVLVHLGETYAMGAKSSGGPWMAGIQDPSDKMDILKTIALEDLALATSGGYGTTFSSDGAHHHLFEPRTGRSTNRYRSVSVIAPDALSADALSTAFSSMHQSEIKRVVDQRKNVHAAILQTNNKILEL